MIWAEAEENYSSVSAILGGTILQAPRSSFVPAGSFQPVDSSRMKRVFDPAEAV
jgi:hypothetical protein